MRKEREEEGEEGKTTGETEEREKGNECKRLVGRGHGGQQKGRGSGEGQKCNRWVVAAWSRRCVQVTGSSGAINPLTDGTTGAPRQ